MITFLNFKFFIIFFLLIFSFGNFKTNSAEIGTNYELGVSFLGDYNYDEPNFMNLRSGYRARRDKVKNIGALFNIKHGFLIKEVLSEFEIDTSYQKFTQSYDSKSSGNMHNIDTDVSNIRVLYGIQMTEKLMLKTGLGFRELYHHWSGKTSSGASAYDRVQNYTYVPILAELNAPISELGLNGKFKLEYGLIINGNLDNKWGHLAGFDNNTEMTNDKGYIWKSSYEAKMNGYILEPYYEFINVDDSNLADGFLEPANTTKEIGLKVKKGFGSSRKEISNFKTIGNNSNFYFGVNALKVKIDTGLSTPTGSTDIDEEDIGRSITSGMNIFKDEWNNRYKLDVEVSYNEFGKAHLACKNGDTFIVDGRYQNSKFAAGTTLSCPSPLVWMIESYSTSIGLKPNINIPLVDGLFVNANLGFHKWDQHELIGQGIADWRNYYGTDRYTGYGVGFKKNNLELGVETLKHNMYYNAESVSVSLKYNF